MKNSIQNQLKWVFGCLCIHKNYKKSEILTLDIWCEEKWPRRGYLKKLKVALKKTFPPPLWKIGTLPFLKLLIFLKNPPVVILIFFNVDPLKSIAVNIKTIFFYIQNIIFVIIQKILIYLKNRFWIVLSLPLWHKRVARVTEGTTQHTELSLLKFQWGEGLVNTAKLSLLELSSIQGCL